MLIGLISMMTGTVDLEGLEKVYRQCWINGMNILAGGADWKARNPAAISGPIKKDGKRPQGAAKA